MKTQVFRINNIGSAKSFLEESAQILKNGGVIAFPTETVYGLGANVFDEKAVSKIFLAKGRPNDNPLIVHISKKEQIYSLAKNVPQKAKKLMDKFWPGPLTIILEKKDVVSNKATAGLSSVAIRMPKNKIAQELIGLSKIPLAAPSANSSGKPSPTKGEHVIDDLMGKVDAIIVSEEENIGLESTVIDLTSKIPVILRPGKITPLQIKNTIGNISTSNENVKGSPKCPGVKYKHYSPKAKVYTFKSEKEIQDFYNKNKSKKIKKLAYSNKNEMAKNLFRDFREADKRGFQLILVKEVSEKGIGSAIMNRLRKASQN